MGTGETERNDYAIALRCPKLGTCHVLTALGSTDIWNRGPFLTVSIELLRTVHSDKASYSVSHVGILNIV